ncbi:hypothetical protein HME9302_02401 [Alteripontixanthobacter maritimus]|uniref:Uncharacterized protein n=2 Tax=Alteripontixanthobacter maritimus TaxID=2161824 RepID=A0A369Q9M6_9SPHN|nr:hypothetical protein HME9302_02401 [Alteripontixanthobacter maritimus]
MDRRAILQRLGWGTVLAAGATGIGGPAYAATGLLQSNPVFDPPDTDLVLRRVLSRPLANPNPAARQEAIIVSRDWRIRFHRQERAYIVSGAQSAVNVDTPSSLAWLADKERARIADTQFPLALDAVGLIGDAGYPSEQHVLNDAIRETRALLETASPPRPEVEAVRNYLVMLAANGAQLLSRWPRDLFAPQRLQWRDARTIALPGGSEGTVEVTFDAETDSQTGMMARASRQVVTSIGTSHRTTSENWSLSAAR